MDLSLADKTLPDRRTKDFIVSIPGKWKAVKAGAFIMGSPSSEKCRDDDENPHQVTLSNDFMIQATEVTQEQYSSLMKRNPSHFVSCGKSCPVEMVSWHHAVAYCNALSVLAGVGKCYDCKGDHKKTACTVKSQYAGKSLYSCPGFRLPTEAEWEYAYRAGTKAAFYNGDISESSCDLCRMDKNADKIAWYCDNSKHSNPPIYTNKAAMKLPNPWGLFDMAGNVFEWCHDGSTLHQPYPKGPATDPVGEGPWRIIRGGAWLFSAKFLRAAERAAFEPTGLYLDTNRFIGFRCVRTLR